MAGAIDTVIRSFAAHSGPEATLVITEHPLDYGPVELGRTVARVAAGCGVSGRVLFLRGGSPPHLIGAARGLVTVNSTLGITALAGGIPLVALGRAIYNFQGLASQQGIDAFWQQPQAPDAALFDAFRKVVTHRTQINGGFFSDTGIALAVAGAMSRLEQCAAEAIIGPLTASSNGSVPPAAHRPWPAFGLAADAAPPR
jgi:capsular polysaccharide export protein